MPLIKRMFITGAGYVGSEVARQAIVRGWEVIALSRNESKLSQLAEMGCQVFCAELDSDSWHQNVSGPFGLVLNTVSSAGGGEAGYRKSYFLGQKSLLAWASKQQIDTYLYTSATSVYPQSDGEWVSEDDVPEVLSPYGSILREAEQLILEGDPQPARRAVILRLAGIYGPDRHLLLRQLIENKGVLSGERDKLLNLIHRDDICAAIFKVVDHPEAAGGIYNLADSYPATRGEIVDWLASQLNLPRPRFDPSQKGVRATGRNLGGKSPNRRISAQKFSREYAFEYLHPDFKSGYLQILKSMHK